MLDFLILLPGILALIGTILPLFNAEAWWIRIFDFPRIQIMFLAIMGIFFSLTYSDLGDYRVIIYNCLLLAAGFYQIFRIYPYTPFSKIQVYDSKMSEHDGQVSIMMFNVLTTNKKSEACRSLIQKVDPDVILLVETDKWWQKELMVLEETYKWKLHAPFGNTYGMLLYSKLPIEDGEIKFLWEYDIPSIHCHLVLKNGVKVKFYGVHPKPPAPGESKSSVKRDAELVMVGKECATLRKPIIVAGDLNDVAWSDTTHLFQRISGLLDPRRGRGMFPTFNSKYKLFRW
ncbi:MAG TPA: endonuclease/exonuclease/phosphatase family protein, partial [Cytophagaceae bacterium]